MATERRLIDANALVERLAYNTTDTWAKNLQAIRNWWPHAVGIKDNIVHMIENAPTVDAVEVVRCKDCIHFDGHHQIGGDETGKVYCYGYCYHWDYEQGMSPNEVDGDDFCSYGERRTDNA